MKTELLPEFIKDLKMLRGTPHFDRIKKLVFEDFALLGSVGAIPNCTQLVGHPLYHRIKIGDYRIGFRYENETIVFIRVKHRKDIYKVFP